MPILHMVAWSTVLGFVLWFLFATTIIDMQKAKYIKSFIEYKTQYCYTIAMGHLINGQLPSSDSFIDFENIKYYFGYDVWTYMNLYYNPSSKKYCCYKKITKNAMEMNIYDDDGYLLYKEECGKMPKFYNQE